MKIPEIKHFSKSRGEGNRLSQWVSLLQDSFVLPKNLWKMHHKFFFICIFVTFLVLRLVGETFFGGRGDKYMLGLKNNSKVMYTLPSEIQIMHSLEFFCAEKVSLGPAPSALRFYDYQNFAAWTHFQHGKTKKIYLILFLFICSQCVTIFLYSERFVASFVNILMDLFTPTIKSTRMLLPELIFNMAKQQRFI